MADQAVPSVNPSNDGSLTGLMQTYFASEMMAMDKCLPAKVVKVDRAANRVTVKPLITRLTTAGEPISRAVIVDVPIMNLSCGTWIINFPIKVGNTGWIFANDRDISLFKQNYKESQPNTLRRHTFEDAIFVPDNCNPNSYSLPGEGLVIQSHDAVTRAHFLENDLTLHVDSGTTKVNLTPNKVLLQANPANFIEILDGGINIKSPVINIIGDLNAGGYSGGLGAVSMSAAVTIKGTIRNNGTDIGSTHIHAQPADGGGDGESDTTPPIN